MAERSAQTLRTAPSGGRVSAARAGSRFALRALAALLVVAGIGTITACTDDDDGPDAAAASTSAGSTAVTLGPPVTGPPPTYIVPEIPSTSVPEICAGADAVVSVDDEISALLGPILASDSSDAADAALLNALSGLKPLVDRASGGYDRMAAALPAELATDAGTVRDATLTFYGAVSASQSMEGLMATVTRARQFSEGAAEAAARLDATTRKVCNKSLYNS